MKRRLFAWLLTLCMLVGLFPATALPVRAEGGDTLTISDAAGWNQFCDLLEQGETFSGKTVQLAADLGTAAAPVTRMAGVIGDNAVPFCGVFDGGGHTLTFANTAVNDNYIAPFRYVSGSYDGHAAVHHLNVNTTISSAGYRHLCGLIALTKGYVDVVSCNAEIDISCAASADNSDLYGQSELLICGGVFTIDDINAIYCTGDLRIVGGTISIGADPEGSTEYGLCGDTIHITGGTVNARAEYYGICSWNGFWYSGGNVVAVGDSEGIYDEYGIDLSWTGPADSIYASSYYGSVTVAEGKPFVTDDEPPVTIPAGPVDDLSRIDGRTLTPAEDPAPVELTSLRLFRNVSIGADMMITFTILESKLSEFDSWYIQVTKDSLEGTETFLYGEGKPEACGLANATYFVDFTHIAAKEMGVMYHAQVFAMKDGVSYCGPVREGSMKQYLAGTLTSADSSVSATLKTLAADMLNYGAAAQSFLNYDTGHLVNAELSETELAALNRYKTRGQAVAEKTNTNTVPEGEPRLLYTSVAMTNRVELGLFVNLNKLSGWQDAQTIEVQMKDHETQQLVAVLPTVLNANGTQMDASFPGVGAKNMRTEYDFVTMVDGVERGNIRTWSIEGYVNQLRQDSTASAAVKALANAVLIYGDSAQRFLDSQN